MSQLEFTAEELSAIREVAAQGTTDAMFAYFISVCKQRDLIPGEHLLCQVRTVKEWDPTLRAKVDVKKLTLVMRIDAFRLTALRSGKYAGQDEVELIYLDENGQPSIVSTIPLPDPENPRYPRQPWAARATVHRSDFAKPLSVTARFEAYAQYMGGGQDGQPSLTSMWRTRGVEQLSKCAEAQALRRAFASELGGIYIAEEVADREVAETVSSPDSQAITPSPTPTPKPTVVPAVNLAVVEGTTEPRPEEPKAEPKPKSAAKPTEPAPASDDENRPPTKAEVGPFGEKARNYSKKYPSIDTDHVKAFLLLRGRVDKTSQVTVAVWKSTFAEIDAALEAGGAEAANKLIHEALNPKEETTDAAF